VQPQDIWLCLGLLIRELGVRYALPDKGWGLTGSGVWTCSGVGVGLAKTRYSSGSFIRCIDQPSGQPASGDLCNGLVSSLCNHTSVVWYDA
jgi:hypothetical protein